MKHNTSQLSINANVNRRQKHIKTLMSTDSKAQKGVEPNHFGPTS